MEAVVLVPARVVAFEAGDLSDDAGVAEPSLLLDLPEQASLELFVRVEPACGHLDTHMRVLGSSKTSSSVRPSRTRVT